MSDMEFFQVQPVYTVGKVVFVLIGSHDVALCVAYVKIGNIMIPVARVGEIMTNQTLIISYEPN